MSQKTAKLRSPASERKYPSGYLSELKSRVAFFDVVKRIAKLEQARGESKTWKARCLFHNEATPSMCFNYNSVGITRVHCFGCGVHYNDPITFLADVLLQQAHNKYPDRFPERTYGYRFPYWQSQAILYLAKMYKFWPNQYKRKNKLGRLA
ncbi:MAG: hypothetical protein RI996_245 [Candidatus Parcubacteria bacterium]|jgi:DNA primase